MPPGDTYQFDGQGQAGYDTGAVVSLAWGNDAVNDAANGDDGDRDERPAAMSHVFVGDGDDHVSVLGGGFKRSEKDTPKNVPKEMGACTIFFPFTCGAP